MTPRSSLAQTTHDPPAAGIPQRATITAIHNDYLECTLNLPGQSQAIKVAKPYKLRHTASNYERPTTLSTVDEQTVTVNDASGPEERWVVIPPYEVGDAIMVQAGVETGLTVSGEPIAYEDENRDGRAWSEDVGGGS
ncbi:MAG: hypothetical protein AAF797_06990 [Planctomycetota bacterium]